MILNRPLVSVVVPSYNHEKFIEKCILSIIQQSYKNFELIVIDDGSQDSSPQILKRLQKRHSFYLELNTNAGLAKTLNRGFRDLAKGKYVTFCASDDFWIIPDKIEKQVNFLEMNTDYAMVYGKTYIVDFQSNVRIKRTKERNKNLKGGNIFKDIMLRKYHPPVNYMFRAIVLEELGYYRENIWAEDFDMNLRISNIHKIGFLNEFLSYYRSGFDAKQKMLNFKTINSHLNSIHQFKNSRYYRPALKAWQYKNFLWYCKFKKTKYLAIKGMLHNPDKIFHKSFILSFFRLLFIWE
jgi:alpha-1,3-rhamnosyltransferase